MRIFKYRINVGITTIPFCLAGRVCHVGHQEGEVFVWIEGGTSYRRRAFCAVLTGQENHYGGDFVGTAQDSNEPYVVHVYELPMLDPRRG